MPVLEIGKEGRVYHPLRHYRQSQSGGGPVTLSPQSKTWESIEAASYTRQRLGVR